MADIKNKQTDNTENDFVLKAKGQDLKPRADELDTEAGRKKDAASVKKAVSVASGRKFLVTTPSEYRGNYFLAGDVVTLQGEDKPSRTWRELNDEEAKAILGSGLAAPGTDIGKPVETDKDGHVL